MSEKRKAVRSGEKFKLVSPGTGAYRVRLVGDDAANTTSILLTGPADETVVTMQPGTYTAIIQPIGSSDVTQQIVELRKGADEPVKLTDRPFAQRIFSAPADAQFLIADSSDVAVDRSRDATRKFFKRAPDWSDERLTAARPGGSTKDYESKNAPRKFALGLSVRYGEGSARSWKRGELRTTTSDAPDGGVAILLRRTPGWKKTPEWRLTVAVAGDRRWRMRVPLLQGGIQVVLTPAMTPDGSDVAVSVSPRDPGRAALVSNLEQMSLGSATEVIRSSFPALPRTSNDRLLESLIDYKVDPWTFLAAALLLVRADELDGSYDTLRNVARKWATPIPDMTVLLAWVAAREDHSREIAERSCLKHLKAISGHPCFAASQALGLDLLTALALGGCTERLKAQAAKERERWARVSRRQLPTGAFLSWEDPRAGRTETLDRRSYATIAEGEVAPGKVDVLAVTPPRSGKELSALAFDRPQIDDDDPWRGRFGGKAERDGYRLDSRFSRGPDGWVEIEITVTAPIAHARSKEQVELFLHDTFHPDRVRLDFIKGVASYTVLAWGGFTVGAWIPDKRIELELDLAQVQGAPSTIYRF